MREAPSNATGEEVAEAVRDALAEVGAVEDADAVALVAVDGDDGEPTEARCLRLTHAFTDDEEIHRTAKEEILRQSTDALGISA